PPDRVRRVLRHRAPDEALHLVEAALLPTKKVELKSVGNGCAPAESPVADRARLVDQPLGLSEPALEQRQGRSVHAGKPRLRWLAQFLGQTCEGFEVGVGLFQVAELGRLVEVNLVLIYITFGVTCLKRDVNFLLR